MSVVWESDYPTIFRIPAIVKTNKNTLLAFCEKRYEGEYDNGKIDIVMKRSLDDGKIWSEEMIVWSDKNNTCGNPCPIVSKDGTVHLLMTWNAGEFTERDIMDGISRRVPFYTKSVDDGLTWEEPKILKGDFADDNWFWYATGPGNGIQLKSGRLIAPCNHSRRFSMGKSPYRAHVLYSDDNGKTWNKSESQADFTNESCVVELDNGDVAQIMRLQNRRCRGIGLSSDGGETWYKQYHEEALESAVCQGSCIKMNDLYLVSVPLLNSRDYLTIYFSKDFRYWNKKTVYCGRGGYSNLVKLDDENFGILYERDSFNYILFERFNVDYLYKDNVSEYVWGTDTIEFPEHVNIYFSQVSQFWKKSMFITININDVFYYVAFDKMKLYSLNSEGTFDEEVDKIKVLNIRKTKRELQDVLEDHQQN